MRKLLLSYFAFILAVSGYSQSVPSNKELAVKRVGNELDSNELEYFGILQNLQAFAPIQFKFDSDNSLTLSYTKNNSPQRFTVESRMANAFATHIVLYEYLAKNEDLADPTAVKTFSIRTPIKRYEKKGNQALLELKDGRSYSGEILTLRDSTVAFWPLNIGYDPAVADSNIIITNLANVNRLYIYKNLPIRWFLATLGVATAIALYSNNIVFPDLKNDAASVSTMLVGYGLVGYGLGTLADGAFRYRKAFTAPQIEMKRSKFENYSIFSQQPPPEVVAKMKAYKHPQR